MTFDFYAFTTGNALEKTSGLMDSDQTQLNTEFFNACRLGNRDEAEAALAKGAELDTERTDMTPLFIAMQGNHRELALWLLEKGADANCRNQYGWSGLHQAVRQNDVELTVAFLDKGALVTRQPARSGETPLMTACMQGNEEIARLLLKKGASVTTMDKQRNTALHYAAANGEAGLCQALLDKGAKVTVLNNEGKNCVDVATQAVASLLDRHTLTEAIEESAQQTKAPETAAAAAPAKRRILKA